jgi:TIR domain
MRVFISWSGDQSKSVADSLRRWIPSVLQAVRPYFSPDDVTKGSRWNTEIAKELEASRIGLLVLTPENQDAPWLLFEAGALAKNLDRSKVCPLLFGGLEPTDVKGPLVQFQAARFETDDMKRLIKMINAELGDIALTADVLESVFDMWWPRLQQEVAAELQKHGSGVREAARSERDILEEVLALTRSFARDRRGRRVSFEHPAFDDLITSVSELMTLLNARALDDDIVRATQVVMRPLSYLRHKGWWRDADRPRGAIDTPDDFDTRMTELLGNIRVRNAGAHSQTKAESSE